MLDQEHRERKAAMAQKRQTLAAAQAAKTGNLLLGAAQRVRLVPTDSDNKRKPEDAAGPPAAKRPKTVARATDAGAGPVPAATFAQDPTDRRFAKDTRFQSLRDEGDASAKRVIKNAQKTGAAAPHVADAGGGARATGGGARVDSRFAQDARFRNLQRLGAS